MLAGSAQAQSLVLASIRSVTRLLSVLDESHWDRTIDAVGWSCRETVEHIGGDFLHYAGQVAQRPTDHYVAFSFDESRADTHALLVETVSMAGHLLAAAVSWAPGTSSAWHPQGMFTPSGFAAMGACEALVHGHDIASCLGIDWEPDDDLSQILIDTFFATTPDEVLGSQRPGEVLLWATGRRSVAGAEDVMAWDYRAAAGR